MSFDVTAHEVMQVRLRLRPELNCRVQTVGENSYYQVEDPLTRRFYRLGQKEWEVARRMDGNRMLGEILDELRPSVATEDNSLSAMDTLQLARWLVQTQLATVEGRFQHKLFDRPPRPRTLPAWLNPAFMRIPLFNPDRMLQRCLPWMRWTLTPAAVVVWSIVCTTAAYQVTCQWDRFTAPIATILAPNNWLYLLIAWAALKGIHEFFHGLICKRHGGQVPVCGIALILFSPVAFVDVTSSWKFRSKWQRIYTAAGGMYAELFIAGLTALLWVRLDDGLLSQMCHNVIVMASLSTLLFNGNFLMRFDGYYIFSDLFDIQNLYGRGQQYVRYLGRRYVLGMPASDSTGAGGQGTITRMYGLASLGWRLLFYVGVVLTSATMFHGAGIVVSLIIGSLWILWPLARLVHFVLHRRGQEQPRRLRFAMVVVAATLVIGGVSRLPWPGDVVTTGVVDYDPIGHVRTASAGFLRAMHVTSGQVVNVGDLLVTIENPRTQADLQEIDIAIQQSEIRGRMMQDDNDVASYQIEKTQQVALEEQRRELAAKVVGLQVTAPISGRVIGRNLSVMQDQFLPSGADVLAIGSDAHKSIVVAVPQQDAEFFLNQLGTRPQIRIRGRGLSIRNAQLVKMDPRASQSLPHPALAAAYGGPLPVAVRGEHEEHAVHGDTLQLCEPHFRATIALPADVARQLRAGELRAYVFRKLDKRLEHTCGASANIGFVESCISSSSIAVASANAVNVAFSGRDGPDPHRPVRC